MFLSFVSAAVNAGWRFDNNVTQCRCERYAENYTRTPSDSGIAIDRGETNDKVQQQDNIDFGIPGVRAAGQRSCVWPRRQGAYVPVELEQPAETLRARIQGR